ncbi:hypothetical protein OY671_005829, partial [Metschnikowia pulcherrima]
MAAARSSARRRSAAVGRPAVRPVLCSTSTPVRRPCSPPGSSRRLTRRGCSAARAAEVGAGDWEDRGMAAEGWTSRHVTVEGREVFVRSGPEVAGAVPIVHVHGFAISGTYLLPTAERLAHRATAVVPDSPGYGRSEEWGHPLGIPALAWALSSTLDALGLDRVVSLGNSMGGPVSLEVAHAAPDRVAGVVLASPAGGVHNQPFGRALTQLARDAVRESPRMARVAVPDYVRFGPVNALQLFAELARFPSLERVSRVPVPTLAVLGTRDPLMPPPWRVREVGALAPPHVTVAAIEGAPHAMNFSHPGELAHVVGCWLDGRDITDDPDEPGVARVLQVARGAGPVRESEERAVTTTAAAVESSIEDSRAVTGYAVRCAEPASELVEAVRPDDARPREAVDAARAFADGGARGKASRDTAWAASRAAKEAGDPAA